MFALYNRLLLVLTLSLVLSIFSVSEVFAQEYPVKMDIVMDKNQFQYGEHIRFKINFEPMTPNSDLKISIISDENYMQGGKILPKNESNSETIDYEMETKTYNSFSTKSDWDGDELGFAYFSILPTNIPSGEYTLMIEFGSEEIPLAKKTIDFSYNEDENSLGQQMKMYFPTNIDIGTNIKISDPSTRFGIVHQNWATILPCDELSCPITVKKMYQKPDFSFVKDLKIYEFTSEIKAKEYAALHKEWDGTPSSRGNSFKVWNPSEIDSNKKQCFEFGGGYTSANGADGLLKCTNGNFVIEVQSTEKIAHDLVENASTKIDSTSTSQITPAKPESKQVETSENIPDTKIIEKIIEPNESSTTEKDNGKLVAGFVDKTKDPQHYIDRYNNEPTYQKWFHDNYPQYDSIEQAVGLELTQKIPDWIKNIFGWYSQDQVSEDELLNAIKYLITEKILIVD